MRDKVIIYPFIKYSCGDKEYGDPIEVNGMVIPKMGDTTSTTGEKYIFRNKVIFDGDVNHVITENDEIELDRIGRVPIQSVGSYNSLRSGCQLIEVYC